MATKLFTNRLILRSPHFSDLNSIVEMDLNQEVQKYLFFRCGKPNHQRL